jgi:hypothetical protein
VASLLIHQLGQGNMMSPFLIAVVCASLSAILPFISQNVAIYSGSGGGLPSGYM